MKKMRNVMAVDLAVAVFLFVVIGIFFVSVSLTVAATPTPQSNVTIPPGQPITLPLIEDIVSILTDFLLYIAGTIAAFFLVLSGILWTTSGGDPTRLTSAKNMFKAAIIGAVIIFGVGVILNTIENCIQGDCLSGRSSFVGSSRGAPCNFDSQCASRRCSPVVIGVGLKVCE